jgi:hypothetical protein
VYVGKTGNWNQRLYQHQRAAGGDYTDTERYTIVPILEEDNSQLRRFAEQRAIDIYQPANNDATPVGESVQRLPGYQSAVRSLVFPTQEEIKIEAVVVRENGFYAGFGELQSEEMFSGGVGRPVGSGEAGEGEIAGGAAE